uniref:UDENN domain-containing protein n=1 Tax=Syphacia muris TaxID=451379 RepID=A0A0N5AT68_9BILA
MPRSEQKLIRTKSLKEVGEVGKLEHLGFDPKLRRCVNRAKLVRRKTLALYNKQEADFCKMTTPQLFDRALNIKLVPKADYPGIYYYDVESAYLPLVSFKYPEEVNKADTLTDCADLFMPDFTRSRPIPEISKWGENEEFLLTLTDMSGKRYLYYFSFAYCIKYLRKRPEEYTEHASTSTDGYLPEVFAIVSPINAPPFYLALVRECVNYIEKGQGTLINFLDAIFRRPFPSKGQELLSGSQNPIFSLMVRCLAILFLIVKILLYYDFCLQLKMVLRMYEMFLFIIHFYSSIISELTTGLGSSLCLVENPNSVQKREFVIQSEGQELGRANCSAVIDRIGIEVSISIIAALLAEQKVLIGGESVTFVFLVKAVSHAVQTFASLLQPFSWPYVLVPVLPDTLLELAKSPTPCFLGVLRHLDITVLFRQNLHKLKELLTATHDLDSDDLLKNDVVIVDLDVGIFVPHPSELCPSDTSQDFSERKRRCAFALCEKLILPKKLVLSLVSSFKEALSDGPGPNADQRIQKAMLVWFASLLGHYKTFSLPHAYLVDLKGNSTELQAAIYQYIMAHPSKTSRRFIKWFVETGLFRDWLRKKVC